MREKVDGLSNEAFDRWNVGISTGVAADNPTHSDVDYADLITQADRRMLRAKSERKDQSEVWGTQSADSYN